MASNNLGRTNQALLIPANGNIGDVVTRIAANDVGWQTPSGAGTVGPGTVGGIAVFVGATAVGDPVAPVTSPEPIAIGVNPALTGAVRLANGASVSFRDAANAGDVQVLQVDGGDTTIVGNSAHDLSLNTGSSMLVNIAGVARIGIGIANIAPEVDDTMDLGAPGGANRFRDCYLAGRVKQDGANGAAAGVVTFTNAPTSNVVQYVPFTFNGAAGWIPFIPA